MGRSSKKRRPGPEGGEPTSTRDDDLSGGRTDSQLGEKAAHPEQREVVRSCSDGKTALQYRLVVHLLLIGIVGLLAYANTFQSPFQWDDTEYIANNPFIKNLDFFAHPSRAEKLLDNAIISRYIGYFSFALNYRVHGFHVTGYHVVNLVIHLINALLVYAMVVLTFRTPYISGGTSAVRGQTSRLADGTPRLFALAVALLFVAHPVQTEAVTYVFQRFASLVSLFYLLSLVLYIQGRILQTAVPAGNAKRQNLLGVACFVLSFIAAVLAMKTKENAFTLPVVMTLYEFLFFRGKVKTRLLRLLPFLLTMLIIPATLAGLSNTAAEVISQMPDPAAMGYQKLTRGEYLITQFRVITTYLRLLLLPLRQNINYDYPIYDSLFDVPVLLSFLLLVALFGGAVYLLVKTGQGARGSETLAAEAGTALAARELREGILSSASYFSANVYGRLIGFGMVWFFVTLSVESSIIPIPMVINEYRMYLPSVGFFLAVVSGVVLLMRRFPAVSPRMVLAAAAVVIVVLASATYARNMLWKDKVSLWEDAVRKSPGSARGYNNLGIAYHEKGMEDRAIAAYERSIANVTYYREAYVNLGVSYFVMGRTDEAIELYIKALEIDPKNPVIYANLGRCFAGIGRYREAAENYLKAIELNPYDSKSFHGLGTAYVNLRSLDDALAAYTRFVELSPNDPEAYRNRGNVYAYKGDFASAGADFRKACSLGSRESCSVLEKPPFR